MAGGNSGGLGGLTKLLLVGLLLYFAYLIWPKQVPELPRLRDRPTSTSPASAPRTPGAAPVLPPSPSPLSQPGSVGRSQAATSSKTPTLSDPGDLPASVYAILLKNIHDMIAQGKLGEAEAKLVALPPEALREPAVRQAAALLWNNLGVGKMDQNGPASGVPAFKTALALAPEHPEVHVNLTHAYWELKDPALTPELLEKVMALAPADPLPHLAMADLLFERDDLAGAAKHLEDANLRIVKKPGLKAYLELVTAKLRRAEKAEKRFLSRSSSHFTVKFNGAEDHQMWDRVLAILEDAYRDIGQKFGYFPQKPIMVVLHTEGTFQSATGSPAWADGLFDFILGRIQIPTKGALTDPVWLTRVLRHEFVHALLHERMGGEPGRVPTWLNEGLAMQLAGDPWPDLDQIVYSEVTLIPLSSLEGGWGRFPAPLAIVAYLEGNSATSFLIDRFGMERMRAVIESLAQGESIASAIHGRLFLSYEDFQRRWVDTINEKMRG